MTAPQGMPDPLPSEASPGGSDMGHVSRQGGSAGGGATRRWGVGAVVKMLLVVAAVVAAITGAWFLARDEPVSATVGDCLAGQEAERLRIVGCSAKEATYEVVGKVTEVTEREWREKPDLCKDYSSVEASYWEGSKGRKGYVLCLKKV